jgi:hypothetical protein
MKMSAPPFYLVWCENGGEPRQKHDTLQSAEREAERLAKVHPGMPFCVMLPVARFTERRVTVERFDVLDTDVPF